MDNKTKSYLFIIGVFLYAVFTTTQYHKIAQQMASMAWYNSLLLYIFLNLSYLFVIIGSIYFYKKRNNALRGVGVGVFLVILMDVLSFPKCQWATNLVNGCGASDSIMTITNSDFYILKALTELGISYKISFIFYYIVVPLILILLIIQIAGLMELNKRFKSMLR